MRTRRAVAVVIAVAMMAGGAATAAAADQPRAASPSVMSSADAGTMANQVDIAFVEMMIPHHFQAQVMSTMAPARAQDQRVLNLADRIDVEQGLEIAMMQGWQTGNGLPVTDAAQAYQQMMSMPDEHLEQMGMATQEQLDDLEASQGTAFDVMLLQLMITHHEGALDMAVEVIINGSDPYLQQIATDMLAQQYMQILQMEEILADLT